MRPSDAAGVRASESAPSDDGYFNWSRPELRSRVPEGARRVLDVGCGAGALGGALREERGIEVVGIELFPDAAEQAAERLDEVIVADLDSLESLPYPDGHFDAMIFGDVLEHLRDPHRLLRALRRYLADDGALVCSFPNVKHWSVVFPLVVQDRWTYEDSGLLDRTHVHFFTLDEAGAMLKETGYDPHTVTRVTDPLPGELTPLAEAAAQLGAELTEVTARLGAYQYLVVATPTPGAPVQRDARATAGTPVIVRSSAADAATTDTTVAHAAATPVAASEPSTGDDAPVATATLLLVLDGSEQEALRCLTAISQLGVDQPEHEIVIVADCAPQLDGLLDLLDGDVTVVKTERPQGFAAAASRGLQHCTRDAVVLMHGAPTVAPSFLTPLLAALAQPGIAAAAAGADAGSNTAAVATAALATRRAALPRTLPAAPAGLELPALCMLLARSGEVVNVPASVASRPAATPTPQLRRAPGEPIELSIVIPTLDAAGERVRRCIAAAQANTDAAHELIVIDNGAPPQGFSAPVNAGLRAARGRYLLVLNDDVELLPGWWAPLRDALDAGAAVVFPDTVDGPMRHDFAAWCFALTRDVLEEFAVADGEFFDPELVVWFQDTDLLERLRSAGRPPQHVQTSKIRHLLSATVNSDEPALRAWVSRQVLRDKAAFEAKHGVGIAGAAY
ncbi:glycosyltransferase [Conexibacter sp. CPCC 206217]|uniref:glycosyltransferase n=1 Tax=Conexibacter sp. CPCC 206217 TaxID=3064574 RepID=UPI00272419C5|nr:glycosyltransferase [Conexibacter sp. CPCC 206217]MDO8211372.1 glycosyltransferase [Conexibacter sp. CPCC 206217]